MKKLPIFLLICLLIGIVACKETEDYWTQYEQWRETNESLFIEQLGAKDEKGNPMLTWKYAESHAMWGMIALFASGLALGKLVIESGAIKELSLLIAALHLSPGLPVMAMACLFACFMSEISSNTASASISIPVVIGITSSLSLNPIPYILGTIAAANCAYILPISTRAIPIGYGLSASAQIRYGTVLSLLTVILITLLCTAFMAFVPLFSEL